MKFNNIFKSILSISGLLLFGLSCEDDEGLNLSQASHRVVITSEMDFDNTIERNGEISFGDVSTGVVSRTWSFPEGVADILNSSNDLTSGESVIKARFTSLGEHGVRLSQVFESDAYVGTDLRGRELDTTIIVRVIGGVTASIAANVVNNDGTLGPNLNIANNARNEILAGSTVRFTATTGGEPEDYTWTAEGGDPETSTDFAETLDVKYKRLGTYDFAFAATRDRPEGGAEISYSNLFTVIPSTEPVTLDAVVEREGNIGLNFSREMEPTTLNAADFSVTIMNGGAEVPNTIASVTVDPTEGNIVVIALENDRIYNDDTVTVSYTAGTMATTDAVAADSFTDVPTIFVGENLLAGTGFDHSFENSMASNWPYQWWGPPWDGYTLEISQNQAQDGNSSALIEMNPQGGMIIGHTDTGGVAIPFSVETGQWYEIGVWVYVEALDAADLADMFAPDLRFYWFPGTDWGVGPNPAFTPDFAVGEWVYSSFLTQFTEAGDHTFAIRGFNEHNSTPTRFYMDNISLSEAVLRP